MEGIVRRCRRECGLEVIRSGESAAYDQREDGNTNGNTTGEGQLDLHMEPEKGFSVAERLSSRLSTEELPSRTGPSSSDGEEHSAERNADSETATGDTTANSTDDVIDPSIPPPNTPAQSSRVGMTPREEALRPWCATAGIPEEVLVRLRNEDVWRPEDLIHLEKQDLADIVRGMKKGIQGRFYAAVHDLRKAKGLVPATPRLPHAISEELNSCSPGSALYSSPGSDHNRTA
mmetsp:Transcript_47906/g.102704  ORF Transcript_47906/g.102704 Transcript_47906/m.102704 type:complete len:232 (+) Transcript_47906:1-696(+)